MPQAGAEHAGRKRDPNRHRLQKQVYKNGPLHSEGRDHSITQAPVGAVSALSPGDHPEQIALPQKAKTKTKTQGRYFQVVGAPEWSFAGPEIGLNRRSGEASQKEQGKEWGPE